MFVFVCVCVCVCVIIIVNYMLLLLLLGLPCVGVDLNEEQWLSVLSVCGERQLLPVLDSAYQGFASGDLQRDAFSARLFVERFCGAFFVTQSFAKNLGLYGERVGMVHAVCASPKEAEAVLSQIKIVARRAYSNPPLHGARILARVLRCKELRRQWEEELHAVACRIKRVRGLLREGLEKKKTPGPWHHITDQIGMFSYTGLTSMFATYTQTTPQRHPK